MNESFVSVCSDMYQRILCFGSFRVNYFYSKRLYISTNVNNIKEGPPLLFIGFRSTSGEPTLIVLSVFACLASIYYLGADRQCKLNNWSMVSQWLINVK